MPWHFFDTLALFAQVTAPLELTAAEVRRIQQMVCGIEIATLGRVHRCD